MAEPKLLDRVGAVARLRHLSLRTGEAYSDWIKRFTLFHRKRHPSGLGADEVRRFISHLAVEGRVSASTQNQALCALLFLYRGVHAAASEIPPVKCFDSEGSELAAAGLVRQPDECLPDSLWEMQPPRVSFVDAVSSVTSERDESGGLHNSSRLRIRAPVRRPRGLPLFNSEGFRLYWNSYETRVRPATCSKGLTAF